MHALRDTDAKLTLECYASIVYNVVGTQRRHQRVAGMSSVIRIRNKTN